jgi:uncharacterized protein (TIGR01777 family)
VKVAVTGASGLIGTSLLPQLRSNGHEVLRLVRRPPRGVDEVEWNPTAGTVTPGAIEGVDAVIHLAGVGVGDKRWSDAYKREILNSRVEGTTTIATLMAGLEHKPSVLVSASAIGIYGDTGDTAVDESAAPGTGFLADVCVQWEAAADPARAAGIRVVHPRTGLVMSSHGGALAKLLPIFKAGIGGRLGSGKQWWSHISMRDEVAALAWLLTAELSGPVNLTAPEPARNSEVTARLATLLNRKAFLPVPAAAMKIALGEFSDDVLGSQRVLPHALTGAGFTFADPTISDSLAAALQE